MSRPRIRLASPRQARQSPAPLSAVEGVIHTIRGERVILDADLAKLYGVPTKALNQAVRRNRDKFPLDFMFELTRKEALDLQKARYQEDVILRSQIVTLRHGRHVKHLPFAFTEHGAIMAANILNSPQAVQMGVFVQIAAQGAPAPEPLRFAPGPCLMA